MSITFESFREALEQEISNWNGFAEALRRGDKESFDALMDIARRYAPELSCSEKTTVLEAMEMSFILEHDNRIKKLEETLKAIKPALPPDEGEKPVEPAVAEKKLLKKPQRILSDFG